MESKQEILCFKNKRYNYIDLNNNAFRWDKMFLQYIVFKNIKKYNQYKRN